MSKYKVGQIVTIMDNKNGHGYRLGEKVEILSANKYNYRGPSGWCFEDNEIKALPMLHTNIKIL